MARRLNVMLDDDAAALLVQLAGGERKQGAYLSSLIRTAAHAAEQGGQDAAASEPPADPTEPIRMGAYEVGAQLNILTNRLMELADSPARAVWTRTDG